MLPTKLEVLNLDLPIWSYKIYKTTFKTGNLNYPMEQAVTDVWDPVVSRTLLSVRQNRGGGAQWRGGGLARRRRGLRRHQGYLHDLRDEPRRMMLPARPRVNRR